MFQVEPTLAGGRNPVLEAIHLVTVNSANELGYRHNEAGSKLEFVERVVASQLLSLLAHVVKKYVKRKE